MRPRRLYELMLFVAAAPALAGCGGVLDPAGPIGGAEKTILLNSLAVMLVIVIPVMMATLAFAWWFRAGNARARYLPDWSHSGRIELIVWSIPALVVIFIGGIAWIGSHRLDPAQSIAGHGPPLEVEVVSLDWKWLFIYPQQGIASVNELVMPAGVPVHFRLTSASVFNTFFVPRLGSQIYTMNGMATQLNLLAQTPGTYHGLSGHFSGDGFADMHFLARAEPAAQFAAWAQATHAAAGPSLDRAEYGRLSRQGVVARPFVYASVEPGLFDAVLTQSLPPGPGPSAGRPDPQTSPRRGAAAGVR
jgi:cytochrome o ubiquinol oxidase subunit 2